MNQHSHPLEDGADGRRFALSVWPPTAERPWQAEIDVLGLPRPIRFDSPVALVRFLTELSPSCDLRRRGLR